MYVYQFVSCNQSVEMDKEGALAAFNLRGTSNNNRLRAELKNQPLFDGFLGPMYGGEKEDGTVVIRYETQEANNMLSI